MRLASATLIAVLLFAAPLQAQDDPGGPGNNPNPTPPSPAEQYAVSEGGVDMRTGQYTYSNTDLSIGGSTGLALVRNNGDSDWKWSKPMGQFSHNWHIYATYAPIKNGGANFSVVGGGRGHGFTSGANTNNFIAYSNTQRASIRGVPTGPNPLDRYLVYTASDGTKITFREEGQYPDSPRLSITSGGLSPGAGYYASKVEEPDGTTYTLTYDEPTSSSPAYLRRVTSNRGYVMVLEHTLVSGFKYVSKVCVINLAVQNAPGTNICPAGVPTATYAYGTNFHMTSFIDAADRIFGYSSTYNATTWENTPWPPKEYEWTETYTYPGESTPYVTNTIFRNPFVQYTKNQTFVDGRTYAYAWNVTEHNESTMEVAGGTWTRNDGATATVRYQEMKRPGWEEGDSYSISVGPNKIIDPLGREVLGDYCIPLIVGGQPPFPPATGCATVPVRYWEYPEGNTAEFTYDLYGNALETRQKAKSGTGLADIVTTAVYNCATELLCKKPQSTTDANGNTTDYTYDATTGQPLTVTSPAVNGVRPQTRYTYTLRNARDVNGALLQPPISLLTEESLCKTTAATGSGCAGGAADEVKTTYDYGPTTGPNNLHLRGTVVDDGGLNLRTCYTYDNLGRRISETQPEGTGGTCP
ncbi:MAG: hypothetical protein AAGE37_08650 [Pseudomonadota bacterium]